MRNEPVYTYVSDAMLDMIDRLGGIDSEVSEGDLSEPVDKFYEDVQSVKIPAAPYRFAGEALRWHFVQCRDFRTNGPRVLVLV